VQFHTFEQRDCYERVYRGLSELEGVVIAAMDDVPAFVVRRGSAQAIVSVFPWLETAAIVRATAFVVQGAEVTQGLMRQLLQWNTEMNFGAFGVNSDNEVVFSHTIVGSTMDPEELWTMVLAVINTADDYDDQIVARWGGVRAIDRDVRTP